MARCGRCGLWNKYPDNWHEEKWAGVCLYYQLRLIPEDVFEERDCEDFLEKVPEVSAMEHFNYKLKRDGLGNAYKTSKRAFWFSCVALTVSIGGLVLKLVS
tara:strand:+ start:6086 stop:6388 length:303 start_codon:yes stop_codon:yes gene_type:complete